MQPPKSTLHQPSPGRCDQRYEVPRIRVTFMVFGALVNKKQPQTENKVGQLLEEVLLCACNSHKIMVTK